MPGDDLVRLTLRHDDSRRSRLFEDLERVEKGVTIPLSALNQRQVKLKGDAELFEFHLGLLLGLLVEAVVRGGRDRDFYPEPRELDSRLPEGLDSRELCARRIRWRGRRR